MLPKDDHVFFEISFEFARLSNNFFVQKYQCYNDTIYVDHMGFQTASVLKAKRFSYIYKNSRYSSAARKEMPN